MAEVHSLLLLPLLVLKRRSNADLISQSLSSSLASQSSPKELSLFCPKTFREMSGMSSRTNLMLMESLSRPQFFLDVKTSTLESESMLAHMILILLLLL